MIIDLESRINDKKSQPEVDIIEMSKFLDQRKSNYKFTALTTTSYFLSLNLDIDIDFHSPSLSACWGVIKFLMTAHKK